MPIRLLIPLPVPIAVGLARSAVAELDIPPIAQWGREWCWAACAEMVFAYYVLPKAQCALVDQLLGSHNCCTGAPPADPQPGCDQSCQPDDVAAVYAHGTNGLTATMEARPLVFAEFVTEITARRPVEVETFLDVARHMILVRWAGEDDGEEMVMYDDPWVARASAHEPFADLESSFADHWWREIRRS